jgi:hypothetical protein
MKRYVLSFILISLCATSAQAVVELDGEFSYRKQVYGATRQNDAVSRSYNGSMAIYLFDLTALEFSYMQNADITTEHNTIAINSAYSIIGFQNRVDSDVYGVGLRQALAPRGSRFRPIISLGYAKQFTYYQTNYDIRTESNGLVFTVNDSSGKSRVDSVTASLGLQIGLTERFALKCSVKTIFPAFKSGLAQDNMSYLAGFTWYL